MTTENFKKLESEILTLIKNTFNELEKEHFEEYALILARAEKTINPSTTGFNILNIIKYY